MSDLGLHWSRCPDLATGWRVVLPWRTAVYGVIRRELDENVVVVLRSGGPQQELEVRCVPQGTHDAHSAGAAGVLVLAATAWILGGWRGGAAAAFTTFVAGLLWTDTTREMALRTLDRRLRVLAEDLGVTLWPGRSAEILPPRKLLS